jgi:hypothetical protein
MGEIEQRWNPISKPSLAHSLLVHPDRDLRMTAAKGFARSSAATSPASDGAPVP